MIDNFKTDKYNLYVFIFLAIYLFLKVFNNLIGFYPLSSLIHNQKIDVILNFRLYATGSSLIALIVPFIYALWIYKISLYCGYNAWLMITLSLYLGFFIVAVLLFLLILAEREKYDANKFKANLISLLSLIIVAFIISFGLKTLKPLESIFVARLISPSELGAFSLTQVFQPYYLILLQSILFLAFAFLIRKDLQKRGENSTKWFWAALLGGFLTLYLYLLLKYIIKKRTSSVETYHND